MPHDLIDAIQPNIAALPESGIVELVNYAREQEGLIPLWVGEGDLPTPAFIADAAVDALRGGQTFYTYQRGIPPLREAVGNYLSRTYDTTVDPERVFITVGGMQAIKQTIQMLIGPGDEIVMPSPVWPNIFVAAQIMGGAVKPVTLTFGNDGWTLDIEKLFDACTERTKAIFVNTPGNPTGWMMSPENMIALRDFARKRGIWLIADEVYGRLTYEVDHAPSFLEITEPDERVVVVNTFSKNWAMTGWRMGWVVASKELGQVYENLIQYNTSGVPTFLQFGALAAMNDGEPFLAEMRERCRAGREIVCDAFDQLPRVRFARPPGTFYLFFKVDGEPDSRALAFKLADQANVGLAPGSAFGEGGDPYLRLCFCMSADKLSEAMDRLSGVLR
jgi:aspartate/methionine/tyrosine aminotransferase